MALYNRYIPRNTTYTPVETEDLPNRQETPDLKPGNDPQQTRGAFSPPKSAPSGDLLGGISDLLGGIFQTVSLEHLDAGDILLALIVLFLFLEGDNLDVVIALGLMLLLGLGEEPQSSG